jgi:pimeloyl-ACP methyl ester carboxylesterase
MPVPLAHRHFGGERQPPLVILHGLLGSSRNWATAGKMLARTFEVFAVDLRGHGDSPPAPKGDYSFRAMADDVADWTKGNGIIRPLLLGHSLGGKVAMRLAMDAPDQWRSVVLADVAPRDYPPHHLAAFDAMQALNLKKITSRAQAEAFMQARLADGDLARFLLTNLVREGDTGFRWRVDVAGLAAALPQLGLSPLAAGEKYAGPTLFLRGSQSDYVREIDHAAITAHFPEGRIVTINNAGHNVHVDQPAAFTSAVENFGRNLE